MGNDIRKTIQKINNAIDATGLTENNAASVLPVDADTAISNGINFNNNIKMAVDNIACIALHLSLIHI